MLGLAKAIDGIDRKHLYYDHAYKWAIIAQL
jgi:hypothetical protein